MKIAIPVNEESIKPSVCISFGRTPYFMIYDTANHNYSFIDNSLAASSQGGAGIKAAQLIVDQGAEILLTPRCGQNAAEVFVAANVQLFKTNSEDAMAVIEAYESGQLAPLTEIHEGLHNHGGK